MVLLVFITSKSELLTLPWSWSISACIRSGFFLSSSPAKVSSLIVRSDLRRFLKMSPLRLLSASYSDSNSLMRVSIFIMALRPPFSALTSASSARAPASLHWASRSFLSFSRFIATSCSQRSSSASLAASPRCEQDVAMNLEKDKKLLEAQCKDAGARADEAEVNALKGGRKAMIKMETRIRELESELDAESRRNGDICKNLRKSEHTIKELTFAGDEDKKNHERMQALIDQLQGKVKSYKKQIEEAEEIAALNLAKYHKVAGALGDAAAEADATEQAAAMRKARARSASLV